MSVSSSVTDLEEIGHDQQSADTELDDDAEIQSINDDDDDDRLETLAEEMDDWGEDEDEDEEGDEEEKKENNSEQKDPTALDTLPYPPYDGGYSFDEEMLNAKLANAGENQQPAKEAAEVVASSDEGEGNDDKADRDAHCNKEIPSIIHRGLLNHIVSCPCMTVPLLILSTTHVVYPLPVIEAALSGQAATCSADVI